MLDLLAKLPPFLLFIVIILLILSIVVISLWGKLTAKWGKNALGVGDTKDGSPKVLEASKKKVSAVHKRSCGSCVLIMMGEREKYEMRMRKTQNRVLKDQMNFTEQKIIEIQSLFIDSYTENVSHKRAEEKANGRDQENIEYKVFYGLLRDSLILVKDEVRRSFKENGFFVLSGNEYATYVKDKTKYLLSILTQNIRNLYPAYGMFISTPDLIHDLESKLSKVEDIVFEVFTHAKETKGDADKSSKSLGAEFSDWIDLFIS